MVVFAGLAERWLVAVVRPGSWGADDALYNKSNHSYNKELIRPLSGGSLQSIVNKRLDESNISKGESNWRCAIACKNRW
jgi:hypothetical protein